MGNGSWLTTLNGYLSEKEQAFKSSIGELFHRDRFSELSSATRSGSLNGLSAQEQLTLLAAAQKNLTLVSSGQEFMSWLRLNGRGDVADFIKSMPSDKRLMASQLASGLYFAIDKDIKGVNAFGEDLNPSIGKGVVILSSSRNLSAQDEAFVIFHEIMHANARQSSVDVELPLEMDRSRQSATVDILPALKDGDSLL